MRTAHLALASTLADLKARGIRPKYIYTIPTVQNPTATVMSVGRRAELLRLAAEYGVPVFEDDTPDTLAARVFEIEKENKE